MAKAYQGRGKAEQDQLRDYSGRVWESFSGKRAQIQKARSLTRLQEVVIKTELQGGSLKSIRTAQAYSILRQWRAMSNSTPAVKVLPRNNSDAEDKVTGEVSRWVGGVPRQFNQGGAFPFRHALWNAGETGVLALRLLFDEECAEQGDFPFQATAIDPAMLAYRRSQRGLLCAVIREKKPAEVLMDELSHAYEKVEAKNPLWEIPPAFKAFADQNGYEDVETTTHYDATNECIWVGGDYGSGELVWDKPHLMPGGHPPVLIGFVGDLPGNKPEEEGMGLIYPVYDSLVNKRVLADKMNMGAEFFYIPLLQMMRQGGMQIAQALPDFYDQVTDAKQLKLAPDAAILQGMQANMDEDIQDATLSKMAFSFFAGRTSGYALTMMMQGLTRTLEDMNFYPELTFQQFYRLLLRAVDKFATPEMAKQCDDPALYMSAFQTWDLNTDYAKGKVDKVVLMDAERLDKHFEVEVSLKPDMPSDKTAQYQMAGIAKGQLNLPDEYIWHEILDVANPAQLKEWRDEEQLRSTNPVYAKYIQTQQLDERAKADPAFAQFLTHEQQMDEQAQAQQPQMGDGSTPPDQGTPPALPGEGGAGMPNRASFGVPPQPPNAAQSENSIGAQAPSANSLPTNGNGQYAPMR